MLEVDGMLRTWRLLDEPGIGRCVRAEELADHRLAYLDYEGPVSGGRGNVARWDSGQFEGTLNAAGSLRVVLQSRKLGQTMTVAIEAGQARFSAADSVGSGANSGDE